MVAKNGFLRFWIRWSTWILVAFLVLYIYVVALYFVYSNQGRLEKFDRQDRHPLHDHGPSGASLLPRGFETPKDLEEFRQRRFEKARSRPVDVEGPGEGGEPVVLTPEEQAEADRLFPKETFNVVASNKMAMDRRIRDLRPAA